jgi:hypothetical protein
MKILIIVLIFIFGAAALVLVARDWRQLRRRAGTVEELPEVRVGDIPWEDFIPEPAPGLPLESLELKQARGSIITMAERHGKNKKGKRKDWRKQPKKRRVVPDDAA